MASTRMLTQLLRSDHIAYQIRPVLNFSEVLHVFHSHLTIDIKTIFMINCGAVSELFLVLRLHSADCLPSFRVQIYNIPKTFGLDQGGDLRIFIMDNHRPIHLENIYSKHNVVLFDNQADIEEDERGFHLPSDGSIVSSGDDKDEDDDNSSNEDVDIDEDDNDEDEDEFDEEGEAAKAEAEMEEEAEMDDEAEEAGEEEEEEEVEEGKKPEEEGEGEGIGVDEINAAFDDNEDEDKEDEEKENDRTVIYDGDGEGEGEGEENEVDENKEEGDEENVNDRKKQYDEDHANASRKRDRTNLDETFVENWQEGQQSQQDDGESGDNTEDDAVVKIVGRKRRTLIDAVANPEREAEKLRRQKLQEYYCRRAHYAAPTALMMMQLVCFRHASHVPLDLIWQAILGVTDQHQRGTMPDKYYEEYCAYLKGQLADHLAAESHTDRVSSYTVRDGSMDGEGTSREVEVVVPSSKVGHIEEALEYRFFLHRHWSLFEAMSHSPYIASKLSVWNSQGTSRLQELLAKMGMPLQVNTGVHTHRDR